MMTITYIYIYLLVFTLLNFVGIAINYFIPIKDKRMLIKIYYWSHALAYSNSYAHAFIILYQGRRNHITMREKKKESISIKLKYYALWNKYLLFNPPLAFEANIQ